MFSFYKFPLFRVLLALYFGSTAGQAVAQQLDPSLITYTISLESDRYGNATLGKIETKLDKAENVYQVSSVTKAQGMAAILMGSSYQESCDFSVNDGRVISEQYSGGRLDSRDYEVEFDYRDRKINFSDGESLDMPQGYIVDNCNMLFAAALLKDNGLGEDSLYIVDGKKQRVRGYQIRSTSTEMLATSLGEFETTKIVLQRELIPERTITLWLSAEHNYLPLRMVEDRRKRTTIFMVDNIEKL